MPEASPQATLKVNTTRFGEIEVPAERVISMPHGMIGFPQQHRYTLFQHRSDSPFYWLQSLDHPQLAFVVVSPLIFDQQYQMVLGTTETELLEIQDTKDIQVWVVVTIPAGQPEKMTANLRAPVVVNLAKRLAAQIILEDPKYPLRKSLKK